MTMPEAPLYEQDRIVLWEHQVGLAGQSGAMKAKAKSELMEAASENHFRLRIFAPNPSHHSAADRRGDDINH